jgi:hypothetical protein
VLRERLPMFCFFADRSLRPRKRRVFGMSVPTDLPFKGKRRSQAKGSVALRLKAKKQLTAILINHKFAD